MAATFELHDRRESGRRRAPLFAPSTQRRAWRAASLAACVALWQLAVHFRLSAGFITFANVPAPSDALPALWSML